ncbi:MAG: hypothetical protein JWL71_2167 [Acidobacteria bacterium]|nr:hypothetical protein [Acidobacteriota bacterium]
MIARMPEGQDFDLERVQETTYEPPTDSLLRNIALTTALLAAFGAVAALRAGGTVNEALVLKTDAGRLQSEASDQWTYYQAKGIKGTVQDAVRTTWIAAGKAVPPAVEQSIQRYAAEQKEIERAARDKERERDEKSREADQLLARHHRFANSVAMLQVGIALGAVAALTRQRLIWGGSAVLGLIGIGQFLLTYLR